MPHSPECRTGCDKRGKSHRQLKDSPAVSRALRKSVGCRVKVAICSLCKPMLRICSVGAIAASGAKRVQCPVLPRGSDLEDRAIAPEKLSVYLVDPAERRCAVEISVRTLDQWCIWRRPIGTKH